MASEDRRLLLIDGHSMAYRAFYALPKENFQTGTGQHTNAVYGFTSMLINLLRDEQPTHFAVAFDVSRKTFRSEKFADYKPRAEPPNWVSGAKIAKLDRVEMLGMPDAQTQVSALINGEVDYLERVPADLLPLFTAKSGAKAEVVSKYGFQAIMRMNHLQPPFDNLKVRQAIARAIDRTMYAAVVAGDPHAPSAATAHHQGHAGI